MGGKIAALFNIWGTPVNLPDEIRWEMLRSPELAYAEVKRVLDARRMEIFSYPNVVGVGIGMKTVRGLPAGEFAVAVFVREKFDAPALVIPKYFDDIPTDVVPARFEAASSIGGDRITPEGSNEGGTLGAAVRCKDRKVRFLTCAHVASPPFGQDINAQIQMADSTGRIGVVRPNKGSIPPGGAMTDAVKGWIREPRVDAALIDPPVKPSGRVGIKGLTQQPVEMRNPRESDVRSSHVEMFSQTAGRLVVGQITHIDVELKLEGTNEPVDDQMRIEWTGSVFARRGDSGSVVVIGDAAVGILRAVQENAAGNPTGVALASRIRYAAASLGFVGIR